MMMLSYYEHATIPNTTMMATRYGRGSAKLKASSCGSSPGSNSMLRWYRHNFDQELGKLCLR
jgi:hypothetical protein